MSINAIIAKWNECGDEEGKYTLFVTTDTPNQSEAFLIIDQVDDPFSANYKIYDWDNFFPVGLESQQQLCSLYNDNSYLDDCECEGKCECVDSMPKECGFENMKNDPNLYDIYK